MPNYPSHSSLRHPLQRGTAQDPVSNRPATPQPLGLNAAHARAQPEFDDLGPVDWLDSAFSLREGLTVLELDALEPRGWDSEEGLPGVR